MYNMTMNEHSFVLINFRESVEFANEQGYIAKRRILYLDMEDDLTNEDLFMEIVDTFESTGIKNIEIKKLTGEVVLRSDKYNKVLQFHRNEGNISNRIMIRIMLLHRSSETNTVPPIQ